MYIVLWICRIFVGIRFNGVWLSLVERYVRDVEAAGSNPVTSTINKALPQSALFYYNNSIGV